jgi:hypothetical protein
MDYRLIPPALIFYTDNLPEDVGGRTNAFVVRIRPKYQGDVGIHKHELEHVKQNWCGLLLVSALLYLFVRRYRLWAEAQAYKKQMIYPDSDGHLMTLDDAAGRLVGPPGYDLGITIEQAKAALQ